MRSVTETCTTGAEAVLRTAPDRAGVPMTGRRFLAPDEERKPSRTPPDPRNQLSVKAGQVHDIEAVADVPMQGGPYRLEGFGPGGELRFAFGFTPNPVDHGGAQFLFNVPYDTERDGALDRVVLSGPGGEFTLGPSSTPPMAIIRDRGSGQVRAIRRDWKGGRTRPGGDFEIMVSDGLPGGAK